MKQEWNDFKASLSEVVTMSKKEFLLTTAVCILGGIVFGLLFSPRKSTVLGSYNGNNNAVDVWRKSEDENYVKGWIG